MSIPKRSGRLAKPILKNGTGLGIINSIAERKKQNPPKSGISLSDFFGFNDTRSTRSRKHVRFAHVRNRTRSRRNPPTSFEQEIAIPLP